MINIVFCLDKKILDSLKAIITSILHHTKRNIHFYVICPNEDNNVFKDYIKKKNINNIKLGNYKPSDKIIKILEKCKFKKSSKFSNYSRFFIKDVFPNIDKVIYLDTDMLVLDDIGKLWDSVEFNSKNYIAAPKYIWSHKLLYLKKISDYLSYLNENKSFFNGGVFMTDLKYWDSKLYGKLYEITYNILNNDISHLFTETLLNMLFPNFLELDPSWNCSGYGQNYLYYLLKLRDCNIDPKIIHWSGNQKPWKNYNVYKKRLWQYYLNENRYFIYLLYYDNNPSNDRAKLFLDSVNDLNFNIVPHNVHQYEKNLDINSTLGRNIKRHFCVKYFIEKNGLDNYYIFTDAYDIIFVNFNYKIIDYIEENNIKILYQNSTLGYSINIFSESVINMYKSDLFSSSYGINGGSFIGRGYNILNYYTDMFTYIRNNDTKDEGLIIRSPNLFKYVTIDTNYFFNINSVHKSLKLDELNTTDLKIFLDLNPEIFLFHYCGKNLKNKFEKAGNYLEKKSFSDMKYSIYRYYFYKIYLILMPIILTIIKFVVVSIYRIINYFKII